MSFTQLLTFSFVAADLSSIALGCVLCDSYYSAQAAKSLNNLSLSHVELWFWQFWQCVSRWRVIYCERGL